MFQRIKNRFTNTPQTTSSRKTRFAPIQRQETRVNPGSVLLQQGTIQRKTTTGQLATGFRSRAVRPSDIALEDLEQVFRQEPLLRRGILKHSSDLVREWFTITDETGEEHPRNEDFQTWAQTQDLRTKLQTLIVSAHVYGDGFLEEAYSDEIGNQGKGDQEVPDTATLEAVFVADATKIELQENNQGHDFAVETRFGASDVRLHPDRYEQLALHTLPGYKHGLSTVEAAWHNAHSKVQADQASGEVLFHCGVPFRHYMIEDGDDDEIQAASRLVNSDEVIRGWVSDETHSIEQQNPEAVDPGPFQEAFVEGIAAAVGMPKATLRGAQAGAVSGSETNRKDYQEDLSSIQENVLSDLIVNLASARLNIPKNELGVSWGQFPVSPMEQADVVQKKARAFSDLVNGGLPPLVAADIAGFDLDDERVRARIEELSGRERVLPPGGGV